MRPLPFVPESLEDLQRRFPEALAEPFDIDYLRLGTCLHPVEIRRHTFDDRNGLRLVVRRIRMVGGREVVAVDGQFMEGLYYHRELTRGELDPNQLHGMAYEWFNLISGDRWPRPDVDGTGSECSWLYLLNDLPTSEGADTHEP